MNEVTSEHIASFDGCKLAVHRMGEGRPVVLLHGLFSSAEMNWLKFGHAKRLAAAGFEAIMPDLRAHGASDKPHGPAAYPPNVLIEDARFLIQALDLKEYDLVGFSLGARTAVEAVIEGLAPRRVVLAGMGLAGLSRWQENCAFFTDAIDRFDAVPKGDPAYLAVAFMKTMGVDRTAVRLLLGAVQNIDAADLARVAMSTAVICGDEDNGNGSPQELAAALPDGRYIEVPGTHMSSVTKPELGEAIVEFLAA